MCLCVYNTGGKDHLCIDSYRGITLTSKVAKVLEFLLIESIFMDAGLPHINQSAYRRGVNLMYRHNLCYTRGNFQVLQGWKQGDPNPACTIYRRLLTRWSTLFSCRNCLRQEWNITWNVTKCDIVFADSLPMCDVDGVAVLSGDVEKCLGYWWKGGLYPPSQLKKTSTKLDTLSSIMVALFSVVTSAPYQQDLCWRHMWCQCQWRRKEYLVGGA